MGIPNHMNHDAPNARDIWKRVVAFVAGMVMGFLGAVILLVEEISPTLTVCTFLLSGLFLAGALVFMLSAVFGCIEWVDVLSGELTSNFWPRDGKTGRHPDGKGRSENPDEGRSQPV